MIPRTSRSPPVAACRRRASRSTTTPTARSPTRAASMSRPAPATRSRRRCRAAGTSPARPAATAARSRTSTSALGEDVTCTFANRKRGTVVVVKDAQPDAPRDFAFTAGGGLSPTSFLLDDDSDGTLSNTRTFADVTPGAGYSLAESVAGRLDPGERHVQRRQPGIQHRRRGGRDGHLHVHEREARCDRGRRGQPAQRRAELLVHGRWRALAGELLARRRLRRHALEHADLHQRRGGLRLLHLARQPAGGLGPDERDLRRRQPRLEHLGVAEARP